MRPPRVGGWVGLSARRLKLAAAAAAHPSSPLLLCAKCSPLVPPRWLILGSHLPFTLLGASFLFHAQERRLPLSCRASQVPPQPGQVLLGYEVCRPRAGCLRCDGLSPVGLVAGEQGAGGAHLRGEQETRRRSEMRGDTLVPCLSPRVPPPLTCAHRPSGGTPAAVIFLLMFCWPLAWVPCVIPGASPPVCSGQAGRRWRGWQGP